MKKLFDFQVTRLKNKRIIMLIPIILVLIGLLGLAIGAMVYGVNGSPKLWLVSVYNSYTQFIFLFMIYVYIATFTDDFENGIYSFMKHKGIYSRV